MPSKIGDKQVDKSLWVWMPHPAHFICSRDCKFHLATYVPRPDGGIGVIVSTVGEYLPDSAVREIFAQSRGIALEGKGDARYADYMQKIGYEDLGWKRKYETMVFRAKRREDAEDARCCPWEIESGRDIDMEGYNTAGDAYAGHMTLCEKWAASTEE